MEIYAIRDFVLKHVPEESQECFIKRMENCLTGSVDYDMPESMIDSLLDFIGGV